jgi:hypothetical protein
MADDKPKQRGWLELIFAVIFFPMKIVVMYSYNCFSDVSLAISAELSDWKNHIEQQRWGR